MVNPTLFPIYLGLHRCKPWIAENGFVFAEIGEEELERDGGRPGSDVQNGVIAEVSASVLCSVNVEQFARFWELFDRKFKPLSVGKVHEIFSCS